MQGFGFDQQVYAELRKQLIATSQLGVDEEEQQQSSLQEPPELDLVVGLGSTLAKEQ